MQKITPDAVKNHWVQRAPERLQPFLRLMRLDRPVGIWLLALPCFWGDALAAIKSEAWPNTLHLLLFACGALVMRSAGCIWNDLTDRKLDAEVERTRARPLASGEISVKAAVTLMCALCLIGFLILLSFNTFTIFLAISSLALVALYPFVKRFSHAPQFVLGFTFNWGALVGYSASIGSIEAPAAFLYFAAAFWTIGYDTIYALQDREDDRIIGIGSTALLFGKYVREAILICYLFCSFMLFFALYFAGAEAFSYVGLGAFLLHLFKQVYDLETIKAANALPLFRSNQFAGFLLCAGLIADATSRVILAQ